MRQISLFRRRFMFLLFASSFCFSKTHVALFCDLESQPARFAVNDIHEALVNKDFIVSEAPSDLQSIDKLQSKDKIIILLAEQGSSETDAAYVKLGGTPVGPLEAQGYAIRKTESKGRTQYWVFGGDEAGVMYGGLRLAEIVQLGELDDLTAEDDAPYFKDRGLKFNIPLDKRVPSFHDGAANGNGDLHRTTVWEMDFWKEYLDYMARYRYNFLGLWNKHPFTSLVKLADYPDVAAHDVYDDSGLVKRMSIEEKIAFWQEVMAYAESRCVRVAWITWNLRLYNARDHYGLTDDIDNPKTIAYMRECVKEMFRLYPQLYGIGVTAGENMEKERAKDNEIFLYETYGKAVLEVARENPDREYLFLHRFWWTDFENITRPFKPLLEQPNIRFDMSFKYSRARVYSITDPPFAKNEVLTVLPETLKCWWLIRNDGILMTRWGDPEFVRSYIKNMPFDQAAGYHMGSDNFVWGRETNLREPDSPRQNQMLHNWYKYMLWGRLGYNPELSDSLFEKVIGMQYPSVNPKLLFKAWQSASQIFPMATRFHWHNWAYMWYVELCGGRDNMAHAQRFYDVLSFMENPVMEGSGLVNISEYTRRTVSGEDFIQNGPVEHALRLIQTGESVLKQVALLDAEGNRELGAILNDIRAMGHYGHYFGYKIRAATCFSFYQHSRDEADRRAAIQHMLRAARHWESYIAILRQQYDPGVITLIKRSPDWDELIWHVRNDVALLGGDYREEMVPITDDTFTGETIDLEHSE